MRVLTDKWMAEQVLFQYILTQATKKLDERKELVAQIKTKGDVEKRQEYVRRKHAEMFGEFPPKTPLHPQILGRLDREDYIVEKIIFESRPEFYVPANLYLPKNREFPIPAILSPCGHSPNGKAYETYQHVFIALVKKGYVVFTFDPIGQGERGPYGDRTTGNHHDASGRQSFLTGNHLSSFMMWDNIRAIDYLFTREEVDKKRIGITGCSGGGTLITHILAVEDRIQVAEPVCFVTTQRKRYEEIYGPMKDIGDAEQVPLNMVKFGIEHADLLLPLAPKALQIGAAERDYFSIVGARETYRELKGLYRILDAEEKVNMTESPAGHGFQKEIREPMYAWMNRWFNKEEEGATEPPITPEPEGNLHCTETGLIATSIGGYTASSLNKALAESIIPKRKPLQNLLQYMEYKTHLKETMKRLTGYSYVDWDLNAEIVSRSEKEDYHLEKLTYTSEPGIVVPALAFIPKTEAPFPAILYVDEAGKSAKLDKIKELVRRGALVLAIDPRGVGETRAKYLDSLCHGAFMLGRTIFGMQLLDVIKAIDYLEKRSDVDKSQLSCIGYHSGGLLAMHAAAIDERITRVISAGALITYTSLIAEPVYSHGVEVFIPHVLKHYDIPDIAALIAPRPLKLLNLVDHKKETVEAEIVAKEYNWTAEIYKLLNRTENFLISSEDG